MKELLGFTSLIGLAVFRAYFLLRHYKLCVFLGNNAVLNVVIKTIRSGDNRMRALGCCKCIHSLPVIEIYGLWEV